ncbi:hypothetical protein F3Y22_tig00004072pilonHSYRG00240 [Hibiscus syriacus]|uniref:Uncharacterized protein n=1 Tax=Hibiscus syriacus TaxID=106335 RepID=A0A6A3CHN9_HIBSY|nr:hypothetical protein F3Y22_tig00004072pilonHSYRG00240 [Hibiscus syriacus]
MAWRSWKDETALELVDPALRDGLTTELMRCLHVGLLCVQADVGETEHGIGCFDAYKLLCHSSGTFTACIFYARQRSIGDRDAMVGRLEFRGYGILSIEKGSHSSFGERGYHYRAPSKIAKELSYL